MVQYCLGDLIQLFNGHATTCRLDGPYPVYSSGGVIGFTDSFLFDAGTILLPRVGTLNNVQYVENKGWATDNIYWVLVNKNLADPYYLYSYLKQLDLSNRHIGSTQPLMTMGLYYSIPVRLPDISSQKKVGSFFHEIDSKISLNRRISDTLQNLCSDIYTYWFKQFEFPNEEGKPYRSSGGKMVWNNELKREIPEGWKVVKLGDLLIEHPKSPIQVSSASRRSGQFPFFTSGENTFFTDIVLVDGTCCFLNTGGNADVKYFCGKAGYSTDTWCISGMGSCANWLFLLLRDNGEELQKKFFQGTGLKHLQKDMLRNKKVVLPDTAIMNAFDAVVRTPMKSISELYLQNKTLTDLRDFLIPLLMNGQITIC